MLFDKKKSVKWETHVNTWTLALKKANKQINILNILNWYLEVE